MQKALKSTTKSTISTFDYLERLLERYKGTFDICSPYRVGEQTYDAYGYFYSHVEKYVLTREANMWSSDSYEHIIFIKEEACTLTLLEELRQLIINYMEPVLVRKEQKLPPANHMYSYLTLAIICEKAPSSEVKKAIRHFKYEKGYQFHMRGFSQAHIICASMEDESVLSNYTGRKAKKLYKELFKALNDIT